MYNWYQLPFTVHSTYQCRTDYYCIITGVPKNYSHVMTLELNILELSMQWYAMVNGPDCIYLGHSEIL